MPESSSDASARFAVSDVEALRLSAQMHRTLIVDFDETLLLRNSTELFLDGIRPRLPGALLLQVLDGLKPWRFTGGMPSRDLWRVRLALIFFPWLLWRWRRVAADMARLWVNPELQEAFIRRPGKSVVVASIGFAPIIAPMLAALGWADVRLAAGRFWRNDRLRGKLALTQAVMPAEEIADAVFITDSLDDLDLLQASGQGCLIKWPKARYIPALSSRYLPFRYLTMVKRPGENYLRRGILQEDFAFWVLASITLSATPWLHLPGLALLLLSFWTIYERGYVDNDLCAERYEKNPKLTPQYLERLVETPVVEPWLWALLSGACGVALLHGTQDMLWPLLAWLCVLIVLHLLYLVYNRADKGTRIWLFAGLQWLRSAAFMSVAAVTLAGALALSAHAIARWMPYYAYRQQGGSKWPEASIFLVRLLFYVVLLCTLALAAGWQQGVSLSAILLLLWNLFRARRELVAVLRSTHRIDRTD